MSDSSALTPREAAALALEAARRGVGVALVTVVAAPRREVVGRRLVVTADRVHGTLGSPESDSRAVELAREALETGKRGVRSIVVEGGGWDLYVEAQEPQPELIIVGAGHIARPLCRLGALIGFRVTVIDDRDDYANREWFPDADRVLVVDFEDPFRDIEIRPDAHIVLVTRAHKYDYDCILELLRQPVRPAYLGMIGSRRRVRAVFEALLAEGVDASSLEHVRAPIGLDIAAETPEEIAVAIAAEIIAGRRGGSGAALSGQERVLKRAASKRGTA